MKTLFVRFLFFLKSLICTLCLHCSKHQDTGELKEERKTGKTCKEEFSDEEKN